MGPIDQAGFGPCDLFAKILSKNIFHVRKFHVLHFCSAPSRGFSFLCSPSSLHKLLPLSSPFPFHSILFIRRPKTLPKEEGGGGSPPSLSVPIPSFARIAISVPPPLQLCRRGGEGKHIIIGCCADGELPGRGVETLEKEREMREWRGQRKKEHAIVERKHRNRESDKIHGMEKVHRDRQSEESM